MSTQSLYDLNSENLCNRIDRYLSCAASSYLMYKKYKIGSKPNIKDSLEVEHMRKILCERRCTLTEKESYKLMEKLNKKLLS